MNEPLIKSSEWTSNDKENQPLNQWNDNDGHWKSGRRKTKRRVRTIKDEWRDQLGMGSAWSGKDGQQSDWSWKSVRLFVVGRMVGWCMRSAAEREMRRRWRRLILGLLFLHRRIVCDHFGALTLFGACGTGLVTFNDNHRLMNLPGKDGQKKKKMKTQLINKKDGGFGLRERRQINWFVLVSIHNLWRLSMVAQKPSPDELRDRYLRVCWWWALFFFVTKKCWLKRLDDDEYKKKIKSTESLIAISQGKKGLDSMTTALVEMNGCWQCMCVRFKCCGCQAVVRQNKEGRKWTVTKFAFKSEQQANLSNLSWVWLNWSDITPDYFKILTHSIHNIYKCQHVSL